VTFPWAGTRSLAEVARRISVLMRRAPALATILAILALSFPRYSSVGGSINLGSAGRASSKARRALTPANTIEGANWNAAIREFESGLRAAGSEGTHREGEADPEGGPALPGWARSKELDLSVPAASMGKDSTPLSRSAPAEVRRVVEGGIPSPVAGGNEEADGRSPGGKPRGGGGLSVGRSRARGGWHGQRAQRVRATLWNQLTPAVPDSVRARVAVRQAPRTWDKQTLALNDKSRTAAAGEIDESPEGVLARAREIIVHVNATLAAVPFRSSRPTRAPGTSARPRAPLTLTRVLRLALVGRAE